MQIETITTNKLIASEGMMLTDGKDFAKMTFLAQGADPSKWYEITEAEYEKIMAEKEAGETEKGGEP
jgi:hypothetical protein